MDTKPFTHKGWFGLCPVYLADLDTDCPLVEPRWWICTPLLYISTLVYQTYSDNGFPIMITGEL